MQPLEPQVIREWAKYLSGISVPILISTWIAKTSYSFDNIFIDFILYLSMVGFVLSSIIYLNSRKIYKYHCEKNHKTRLKKSVIGIFKEDNLKLSKSKFKPDYWKNLVNQKYDTREISGLKPEQISDDLVAIINPYGECYPELDLGTRSTFKQIKEYVKNGGIFVNICGAPFWYAWNKEVGQISTASEVYGQRGKAILSKVQLPPTNIGNYTTNTPVFQEYEVNLQEPTYNPEPVQSLSDTLAFHELKILTTGGPPRLIQLTQKNDEINRFGYLPRFGQDRFIFEFRAIRKPSQNFKPIVRAKIPNYSNPKKKTLDIFPISYVPWGRGKFLISGMHMNLKCEDEQLVIYTDEEEEYLIHWNSFYKGLTKSIINEQPKIIYEALDVLIEEQKNKYLGKQKRKNNPDKEFQSSKFSNINCRM